MPFLVIIIALAIAFRLYSVAKKRRATRAILYLSGIFNEEFNEDKINEVNALVWTLSDNTLDAMEKETRAMRYQLHGGSRSTAIRHAKLEGFSG